MTNHANDIIDANEIITNHFENWSDGATPLGQSASEGFIVWCCDMLERAHYDLVVGDFGHLAPEIVYSVAQERPKRTITEEQAEAWLRENAEELKDAINKLDQWGDLNDYKTGERIRSATLTEKLKSKDAAKYDGGSGVIDVDGRSCFVD